ncbi:MAG: BON domain-containing protein [Gammaproteobacteria bacterium]|jgi:osmotically-inducible protein OsmY
MKNRLKQLWLLCLFLPAATYGVNNAVCTDPCLKAAIAALYLRSPFLSPFSIDIKVTDAVATLQGTVATLPERRLAEEVAASVDGLRSVVNNIHVKPSASAEAAAGRPVECLADDATLARRVRAQLRWNRATHGMVVEVSSRDGAVTLDGEASNAQQAELARLIVLNTCGVQQVTSRLQLRREH